jgi:acyl-CoA thioesterase-1
MAGFLRRALCVGLFFYAAVFAADGEEKKVLLLGDDVLFACETAVVQLLEGKAECTFVRMPETADLDWTAFFRGQVNTSRWDVIHFSCTRPLMIQSGRANVTGLIAELQKTGACLVGASLTPVRGSMPGLSRKEDSNSARVFKKTLKSEGIRLNDLGDYTQTRLAEMVQINSNLPTEMGVQLMAEQIVNGVLEAMNEGADPNRPRILIVGDSIAGGYYSATRWLFAGRAAVFSGGTTYNDRNPDWKKIVDQYIEKGGEKGWAVIQFNWGLHAVKFVDEQNRNSEPGKPGAHIQFTVEEYARNLELFVNELKRTGAKLVFATTTPVPKGASGSIRHLDLTPYNEAAKEIMKKHGIPVNDLYAAALLRLPALQIENSVHFTASGSAELAKQNFEVLLPLLAR